jgi:hypothetical protein
VMGYADLAMRGEVIDGDILQRSAWVLANEQVSDETEAWAAGILQAERDRAQRTRDRHAREAFARFGADFGKSREAVRQWLYPGKVKEELGIGDSSEEWLARFPGLASARSEAARYAVLRGDDRRPLYAKLSRDVYAAFDEECRARGAGKAELLEAILRGRYDLDTD